MYSDNINKSVAEAVKKVIDEELKGKQKVLDKNHNNKLDSQDFKILRGQKKANEEVEQVEEGIEDRLEAARAKAKAAGKPIKDKPAAPKSNVRKIEGGAYGGSKQKDEVEPDDEDDTPKKAVKKGTFKRRYNTKTYKESFTDRLEAYKEGGLKSLLETMQYEIVEEEIIEEEATNDEFTKELDDAKAKNSGAKKNKEIATPAVQAVKNEEVEQIDELSLNTKTSAYSARVGRSMDSGEKRDDDKAQQTLSRIGAKHGVKGVAKAVNKADADHDPFGGDSPTHPGSDPKNTAKRDNKRELMKLHGVRKEDMDIDGVRMSTIGEAEMTDAEMKKREHIVKSMKKGLDGFKERYGKDAKSVMYATATKQAKGE